MNCNSPLSRTLLVATALALLRCELNNGTLNRAQDCFPLRSGSMWYYQHHDGTFSRLTVRGDSVAFNSPCVVLEQDAAELYWTKEQGNLLKFVEYLLNVNGTDYPLEQRYRRYYVLPLVLGNSWSEDYRAAVPILGDTIAFFHSIRGEVSAIESVQVPAGSFDQCYLVNLTEVLRQNDAEQTILTQEWYAPGVGLVKRVQGSAVWELKEYQLP